MLSAFIEREPGIVSAVSDKLGQGDEHFPYHLLHSHDCCLGYHLGHHIAHGHLHDGDLATLVTDQVDRNDIRNS